MNSCICDSSSNYIYSYRIIAVVGIGCYFVIVYVGHFWPPNVGPLSVQSLIYMPISLIFTPIYFFRMPLLVFSVRGLGEHARGEFTHNII